MNWKFLLFLIVLCTITFFGGYQFQLLNFHHNDPATWTIRIAVIVLCAGGLFVTIIQFITQRRGLPVGTVLFMIMLSWIAALLAGNKINSIRSAQTKERATEIIMACYNYYAEHNRYPESLKELKPTFLKEIPTSTLGTAPAAFEYYSSKDHFAITYEDIKSKVMRYDSNEKVWEVLDRSFE